MSSKLLMRERQQQSGVCISSSTQDVDIISTLSLSADPFADNEFVSSPNRNDVQGFISDRFRVMHPPSPPQVLLVAEELFRNIKVYFEDSCQKMIFDDHGTLLNPNGAELHNDLCNEFDSYCFTATMFIGRELSAEFRRALSKASALVEQILRAEHPRTLACFLEVSIHLIQTGLPDVASFLRDFIKKCPNKSPGEGILGVKSVGFSGNLTRSLLTRLWHKFGNALLILMRANLERPIDLLCLFVSIT